MVTTLSTPLESIFNFICYDLPNLAISFLNVFFTPLKEVVGNAVYQVIRNLFVGMLPPPFSNVVWNFVFDPIFSLGFAGLFSVTGLVIILILKLIDLVIPI